MLKLKPAFVFAFVFILVECGSVIATVLPGSFVEPSRKFNLNGWKLQIPGPKEMLHLATYASTYFYLNKDDEMVFWVNSSEKGTTKNAIFVRSELRHLSNWMIDGNYKLQAILRVESELSPNKVTVMKIHGFIKPGEYAPTLVRIALNSGELFAYINRSNTPKDVVRVLLASNMDRQSFKCQIEINDGHLTIRINDEVRLTRDISYWKYKNYFKAGCYPQAHYGSVKVMFKDLKVWIDDK